MGCIESTDPFIHAQIHNPTKGVELINRNKNQQPAVASSDENAWTANNSSSAIDEGLLRDAIGTVMREKDEGVREFLMRGSRVVRRVGLMNECAVISWMNEWIYPLSGGKERPQPLHPRPRHRKSDSQIIEPFCCIFYSWFDPLLSNHSFILLLQKRNPSKSNLPPIPRLQPAFPQSVHLSPLHHHRCLLMIHQQQH